MVVFIRAILAPEIATFCILTIRFFFATSIIPNYPILYYRTQFYKEKQEFIVCLQKTTQTKQQKIII